MQHLGDETDTQRCRKDELHERKCEGYWSPKTTKEPSLESSRLANLRRWGQIIPSASHVIEELVPTGIRSNKPVQAIHPRRDTAQAVGSRMKQQPPFVLGPATLLVSVLS